MKNILRKNLTAFAFSAAFFGGLSAYSLPAKALTVYCSNCGTTWQQALELTEAVSTQINTAKQLQDSIQQAISLPDRMFRDVMGDVQQVTNMYHDIQSVGRDFSNLENQFRQQYKGYDQYLSSIGQASAIMPGRYEQWAASGLDNARVALKTAGFHVKSFDSESQMLDQIMSRSSSASGRMQALQASNEIAAANVQQLQKLRDMMSSQINLQANYVATQTERAAIEDAISDSFSTQPNNSPAKDY